MPNVKYSDNPVTPLIIINKAFPGSTFTGYSGTTGPVPPLAQSASVRGIELVRSLLIVHSTARSLASQFAVVSAYT